MSRVALFSLVALQLVQAMPTHSAHRRLGARSTALLAAEENETLASVKAATIKYIVEIRGEKNSVVELFRKARIGSLEGIEKSRKHALNKITEDIKANSTTTELVGVPEMLMADATADLVLYDTRDPDTDLLAADSEVEFADLLKAKSEAIHSIKRMKLDTLEYVKRLKKKSEEAVMLAKQKGVESLGITPSDYTFKTEEEKQKEKEDKEEGIGLLAGRRSSVAVDKAHEAVLVQLLKEVDENELIQLLTPAWASDVAAVPWHSLAHGMSIEKIESIALAAVKASKVSCLLYLKTVKKNMLEAIAEARNNAIKDVKAFIDKKAPDEQ